MPIPLYLIGGKAVTVQQTFRFRNDDGSEATATFMGSGNGEDQTIDTDVKFRIRFVIEETAGGTSNVAATLYYSHNSGTYTDIATTGDIIRAIASDYDPDPQDDQELATPRLGYSGAYANGRFDDDGVATTAPSLSESYTEFEFCLIIPSGTVQTNDTIDLRVYNNDVAIDTYTDTPRITVNVAAVQKDATDSGSGSDAVSAFTRSVHDSGSGADSIPALTRSVHDSGSGVDSISALAVSLTQTDTGSGADSAQKTDEAARVVRHPVYRHWIATPYVIAGWPAGATQKDASDSGTGADAVSALAASTSATDSGAGTESVSIAVSLPASDTGAGVDSVPALAVSISAAETGVGTEAVAQSQAVIDTGTAADSLGALAANQVLTDSGSGADAVTRQLQALADSGSGSDSIPQLAGALTITEVGSGADQIITLTVELTVTDTGAGVDAVDVDQGSVPKDAYDSGTGADSVTQITVTLPATDTGSGVEIPASTADLATTDSGVGTETPAIASAQAVSDTGLGADAVGGPYEETLKQATDSGAGVGSIPQLAGVTTIAEAGAGTEQVTIAVSIVVTDAGSGADAIYLEQLWSVSDTGSGLDQLSQLDAIAVVVDSGIGADTISIAGALALTDSGIGVEAYQKGVAGKTIGSDMALMIDAESRVLVIDAETRALVVSEEVRAVKN